MMNSLLVLMLAAAAPRPTVAPLATPPPLSTPPPLATPQPTPPADGDEYRVGAGDVLDIVVVNDPQFSRPAAVVQTNGMITIPLVGDVAVASLTVAEIRTKLVRLLDGYLVRPQVEVRVREFVSQYVTVMGEVNSPGKKPLRGQTRLVDVLTEAGSFRPSASGEIIITRSDGTFSGGEKTLRVHVGRSAPTAQDLISLQVPLRHLDLIQALQKYYVSIDGEVARPARYVLEPDLTVTGLISMAGGLTKWAKNEVKILRRVENSPQSVKIIEVNFKDVRKGKKADVPLEPNDVVSVGRRLF
jgi:polysaccharide biosynthesis/export protein